MKSIHKSQELNEAITESVFSQIEELSLPKLKLITYGGINSFALGFLRNNPGLKGTIEIDIFIRSILSYVKFLISVEETNAKLKTEFFKKLVKRKKK